jgi:hypothetical protein
MRDLPRFRRLSGQSAERRIVLWATLICRRRMPPLKVKADTLFSSALRLSPRSATTSFGTHHIRASAAHWWRHSTDKNPSLAWIANSRWTMNGGYIDERRRVKKIAVCTCIFLTQRELCRRTTLRVARTSGAPNLCRFYAGFVFLIGRCALSARVLFHCVVRMDKQIVSFTGQMNRPLIAS